MADGRRRFEDKVVLITGGGAGLGLSYAHGFAAEGARLVLADIDGDAAAKAAAEITATGADALGVQADVADEGAVVAMAAAAAAAFGGVDVLVNNAGLHLGQYNSSLGLPAEEWRRILDVNVLGAMLCARECRPLMAARGGGVVLNQGSVAAWADASGAYGVSKLALTGLTVSLASEMAADRIRVVAIAPGMFASQAIIDRMEPAHTDIVTSRQLVDRIGTPDDLTPTVLFLCSEEAAFANAATYVLDGGFTKRI